MKRTFGLLLGFGLIAATIIASIVLMRTAESPRRFPRPQSIPVVELAPLTKAARLIEVVGFGTVRPAEEVSLRPQVSGMVTETSAGLFPGGLVRQGELLFQIDRRDYEFALNNRQARVAQARASLEIEAGQQSIARREWEMIAQRLDAREANRALALREPQLRQARANMIQAEADLSTAQLNFERTTLSSPFNAVVITENVDLGDVVSVGQEAAILAGTNTFWIEVQISQEDAVRLARALSDSGTDRLPATVIDQDNPGSTRQATLISILSNLADGSRLATAIVEVNDPLLLVDGASSAAPIFIGSYVEVHVEAGTLPESYAFPMTALHENDVIWVRDADGKLAFRTITPILSQDDTLFADGQFADGDQLVLTRVARAVPGMEILTAEEAAARRASAFGGGGGPSGGPGGGGSGGGLPPFLANMDADGDGKIKKDEARGPIETNFDAIDADSDGFVTAAEIAARRAAGGGPSGASGGPPSNASAPPAEEDSLPPFLVGMDANGDGGIQKDEAQGPIAANFDAIDANSDGTATTAEIAARRAAQGGPGGGPPSTSAGPDNAAAALPPFLSGMDSNGDGSIQRSEAQGRFADNFDSIDTDGNDIVTGAEIAARRAAGGGR